MADDKILDDVHESVEFFSNLSCRWEDEHEYEDSSEYSSAFTKNFPKLIVDKIHDSSLYLGFDVHHSDAPERYFQFRSTEKAIHLIELERKR
jgi:hypothetical protein